MQNEHAPHFRRSLIDLLRDRWDNFWIGRSLEKIHNQTQPEFSLVERQKHLFRFNYASIVDQIPTARQVVLIDYFTVAQIIRDYFRA